MNTAKLFFLLFYGLGLYCSIAWIRVAIQEHMTSMIIFYSVLSVALIFVLYLVARS